MRVGPWKGRGAVPAACMLGLLTAAPSLAAEAPSGEVLETVTVIAAGVSNMDAASAGDVGTQRIGVEPLLRPAAVLENVPGLIVTQHSGEGKANQYFLRAFNLDHGTDIALDVDGMPVNMPTHAHGQGYADLNFMIPELISDLHYKKGPYYSDEGDFATAAAVRIGLLDRVPSEVTLGYGEDGYRRALAMGTTSVGSGSLLAAGEAYHNDGPFQVPDDYRRLNGVLRYSQRDERNSLAVTAMAYSGDWNSTDQVPERAIDAGLIGRFGNLTPTDGGETSRSSLSLNWVGRSDSGRSQVAAYVIRYKLDLWSTFTYYLKDPTYGDQMLQQDDRVVYGLEGSKTWLGSLGDVPMATVLGAQARYDDIRDVGIFPTFQRQIIGTTQNAGVNESSAAIYAENTLQWRSWMRTVIGIREDRFGFDVRDKMVNLDGSCNTVSDPLGCDTGRRGASLFSPKVGWVLGPWRKTTGYINFGYGYHSNDARGVTRSGDNPADPAVTPLTRAVGGEVGMTSEVVPGLRASLDVFELKLRSELVFDGDAGSTAPSGATTRRGIELGSDYRLRDWLSADLNAAFTRGRFDRDTPADDLGCSDAAPGHPCTQPIAIVGRYIPNSPASVIEAGLSVHPRAGWLGSLQLRHFGESPLVEDDSARSAAYTTLDGRLGYRSRQGWLLALDVFNLANVRWNDIEYYYVSRLHDEASPEAGYVVHPGVPRTWRLNFQYRF